MNNVNNKLISFISKPWIKSQYSVFTIFGKCKIKQVQIEMSQESQYILSYNIVLGCP